MTKKRSLEQWVVLTIWIVVSVLLALPVTLLVAAQIVGNVAGATAEHVADAMLGIHKWCES